MARGCGKYRLQYKEIQEVPSYNRYKGFPKVR